AKERAEKFKALRAKAKTSAEQNRKEVYAERRRQQADPNEDNKLARKSARAEYKLAKTEAAEDGEDFERKRAWDWTIEEAERWDKKQDKKEKHRNDVAFQDYDQLARKIYKRQMRELKPDMDGYNKEKEKILMDGEIVETEDGELVAIDRDGKFFATADSLSFVDSKPDKKAVDRLVQDLRKAEEVRNKRKRNGDEDDVTYINDKNKRFNKKLSRFYDGYTQEIRDSFERGTMI
ncbi:SYF2-domain-containing protein, partial [Ascobolus immersus RN42]